MAVDRDAALKKAEKLLRQGKLEGAIQEYVRLVEEQPRDWNLMNALGDLYARAGDAERAAAQFTRVADYLHGEGFFPKAAALYKKTLKTLPDHEHSLLRLGEMATRQGLVADARTYLNQAARLRRARGDERGADECLVMLGVLPDPGLKLAAGKAALAAGDAAAGVELLLTAADVLDKQGRSAEALEALAAAAEVDAAGPALRARVAARFVDAGDVDGARRFLSPETAGDDPDLLLALGRIELGSGRHDEARPVLARLLAVAPDRAADVLHLADGLARSGDTDAAFDCVDAVAETSLLDARFEAAIDALLAFLRHGPHIPALIKLVEVAVDAGRDDLVTDAQEQLADAYLDAGRGAEARAIAEDLVTRDPARGENVQRLRRALTQSGEPDPDAVLARLLESSEGGDAALPELDFNPAPGELPAEHADLPEPQPALTGSDAEPDASSISAPGDTGPEAHEIVLEEALPDSTTDRSVMDIPPVPGAEASPAGGEEEESEDDGGHIDVEAVEIDLSDALAQLAADPSTFVPPAAPLPDTPDARPATAQSGQSANAPDLEAVFEQMRARVREHPGTAPAAQLEQGLRLLDGGCTAEALPLLEAAARAPMLRFSATRALARLHAVQGDLAAAVEWLERAADAPAPSETDNLAVLYELAATLEQMGERARALAVLLEIAAAGTSYRDVPARIDQLTRAQAGSRGH